MATVLTPPQVMNPRALAVGALVVVLHFTVLRQVSLFGVRPDVLLLATLCAAVVFPLRTGMALAFAAGLAADLFTLFPFGTSALAYMVGAAGARALGRNARPVAVGQAFIVGLTSAVAVLAQTLVAAAAGERTSGAGSVLVIVVVVALLNAALAPVVFRIFRSRDGLRASRTKR